MAHDPGKAEPPSEFAANRAARAAGRRFVVKFALFAGLAFGVYCFPYELFGKKDDFLDGYLAAYARLAGSVLGLLDPSVHVVGRTIYGRFSLEIIRSCDAIEINILFASAVLAFPARAARKALAVALGLAGLVVLNVARLASLYYVGVYRAAWFETFHLELWPLAMVAVAALSFVGWARWLQAETEGAGGPHAA